MCWTRRKKFDGLHGSFEEPTGVITLVDSAGKTVFSGTNWSFNRFLDKHRIARADISWSYPDSEKESYYYALRG